MRPAQEIKSTYMSSNGEMKMSLKLIIYTVSVNASGWLFRQGTDILVAEMLEQFQLPVGSLGQHRGAERLHDFLDCDWLRCQLILCRAVEWPS